MPLVGLNHTVDIRLKFFCAIFRLCFSVLSEIGLLIVCFHETLYDCSFDPCGPKFAALVEVFSMLHQEGFKCHKFRTVSDYRMIVKCPIETGWLLTTLKQPCFNISLLMCSFTAFPCHFLYKP